MRIDTARRRRGRGARKGYLWGLEKGAPIRIDGLKTVDARIVTDLVGLACEGAYDVAILVSSDKDVIPAVEHIQANNFKVINAAWKNRDNELAKVCWASFEPADRAADIV
jgi:hypothetical protein